MPSDRGGRRAEPDNGIYIAIDPLITFDDEGHISNAHYQAAPLKNTDGDEVTLFDLVRLAMNDRDIIPYIDMERAKRAAKEISKHYDRMNAATKAAEKKEVQEPCHLPALSSLPSTPMQQFLFLSLIHI